MAEIGFEDVEVVWKRYNFAVYRGLKRQERLFADRQRSPSDAYKEGEVL